MQHFETNTLIKFKSITDGNSFDIHTIEWLEENRFYENDTAQSNNHFQIIWITKGNGNFWIDLHKSYFQNNQFFFIKPCQVYHFQPVNKLEGYVISFTDSFIGIEEQTSDSTYHNSLFQLFTNTNGIRINDEMELEIKDFAERMIKEYNNVHLFKDEMLRRYLKIFFIYIKTV